MFDYIRRAMPPDAPGSLRDAEVYGLTRVLLTLNELIPLTPSSMQPRYQKVKMPSKDRFKPDMQGTPK